MCRLKAGTALLWADLPTRHTRELSQRISIPPVTSMVAPVV